MCHNTSCNAKEQTLFLRKKFDWGKFSVNTQQLYFHCRCQLGAWPRQRNTFIRRTYGDCKQLDQMWIQLPVTKLWLHHLDLKWKWSKRPTLTHRYQKMCNKHSSHAQTLSLLSQHESIDVVETVRRRRFALEMWWKSGSGNSECNNEWQHIL